MHARQHTYARIARVRLIRARDKTHLLLLLLTVRRQAADKYSREHSQTGSASELANESNVRAARTGGCV